MLPRTDSSHVSVAHATQFFTNEEFEQFDAFYSTEVEIERKFKCFAYCILDKLQYLNAFSGKFDIENFQQQDGIEEQDVALDITIAFAICTHPYHTLLALICTHTHDWLAMNELHHRHHHQQHHHHHHYHHHNHHHHHHERREMSCG
uniref:Uncharacterized protein n=1 Tax=Glossina brevipalpis TaxID=37001 RepID=A0A1A9X2J0_9MUSC